MYTVGDVARIECEFKNVEVGNYVDPDSVVIRVRKPTGARLTFTYGTDPEIVRDDVGRYHLDLLLTSPSSPAGTNWTYHSFGPGANAAAGHETMKVARALA